MCFFISSSLPSSGHFVARDDHAAARANSQAINRVHVVGLSALPAWLLYEYYSLLPLHQIPGHHLTRKYFGVMAGSASLFPRRFIRPRKAYSSFTYFLTIAYISLLTPQLIS